MEPRLKTALWVQAVLRQANGQGVPGMVLRKGDADAGAVLVVLRDRAGGLCVLSQTRVGEGALAWMRATGAQPVDQEAADSYIARQLRFDSDIWVVEFECADLMPPFEARIV